MKELTGAMILAQLYSLPRDGFYREKLVSGIPKSGYQTTCKGRAYTSDDERAFQKRVKARRKKKGYK